LDSHANTQPRGAIPAHVGEERIVEDGVWRLDVAARGPRNVTVSKVPGVRRRQQHAEDEAQQCILGHHGGSRPGARCHSPPSSMRLVPHAPFPHSPPPSILIAQPEATFMFVEENRLKKQNICNVYRAGAVRWRQSGWP